MGHSTVVVHLLLLLLSTQMRIVIYNPLVSIRELLLRDSHAPLAVQVLGADVCRLRLLPVPTRGVFVVVSRLLSPRQTMCVVLVVLPRRMLLLLLPVVYAGLPRQTVRVVKGLLVRLYVLKVVEYLRVELERDHAVLGGEVCRPKRGAALCRRISRVGRCHDVAPGRLGEVALA